MSSISAGQDADSVASGSTESSNFSKRAGDAFGVGVLVMLFISIFQRCVGLIRGIGFCHFLDDGQLGHWALLNSAILVGVPLAVLGLPGSFGKFSEYYRSRGQLGNYVRRVLLVSATSLAALSSLIILLPQQFSWLVLGESLQTSYVLWCVAALVGAAVFSFVNELVASLRQVRVVSVMQFAQSATFCVAGLVLLAIWPTWTVLVPAFFVSCCVAACPGLWVLAKKYSGELKPAKEIAAGSLWARILPYAGMLWLMNFLSNLFATADLYMLLHLSESGRGDNLVGQYHASYILPKLLISVALMLSGVLLPYFSQDWEAGKRDQIAARLRQVLQSICVGFLTLSIAAMVAAPVLYELLFQGRYAEAQDVLPFALLQATWMGLFFIAEAYMLCVNRGKMLLVLLSSSLALNFALNFLLVPMFELHGAVAATSIAQLVILVLVLVAIQRVDPIGWGTIALCLTPACLALGPVVSTCVVVALVHIAGRTDWLLSQTDRHAIDQTIIPRLQRFGIPLESLWPVHS